MVTILIVEDDELMARLYRKVFNFEGFQVELAEDGQAGLDKAREILPNLILLDVMMPRLNGLDALTQLKADPKTKNIPVIMLTNLAGQQDAEAALAKGAARYAIKSENEPKDVVNLVNEVLNGAGTPLAPTTPDAQAGTGSTPTAQPAAGAPASQPTAAPAPAALAQSAAQPQLVPAQPQLTPAQPQPAPVQPQPGQPVTPAPTQQVAVPQSAASPIQAPAVPIQTAMAPVQAAPIQTGLAAPQAPAAAQAPSVPAPASTPQPATSQSVATPAQPTAPASTAPLGQTPQTPVSSEPSQPA